MKNSRASQLGYFSIVKCIQGCDYLLNNQFVMFITTNIYKLNLIHNKSRLNFTFLTTKSQFLLLYRKVSNLINAGFSPSVKAVAGAYLGGDFYGETFPFDGAFHRF